MALVGGEKLDRHEAILLEKESKKNRNFIRRIVDELAYPSVYVVVKYLDVVQHLKSYFHKSKIHEFIPYRDGQKIALIAIWEYSDLRKDVRVLVEELIKRDFYICVVNTGKINAKSFSGLASVYIERFNYGRDFGSYKVGIQYLEKDNKIGQADKFLLCNDSVYYLQDLVSPALDNFLGSTLDVAGATENFEISQHLGSFFIMFSKLVINSREFKKFWKKFRLTDIRPNNIEYGELRLNEKVKKAVNENQIQALWSLSRLSREFNDVDKISQAMNLINRGHITQWKKLSWQFISKSFVSERILFTSEFNKSQGMILQGSDSKDSNSNQPELILEYQDVVNLIEGYIGRDVGTQDLFELKMKAKGLWLETAASGSQIHQNNNLFVSMGCPLVKIDLIYRGAFSFEDAEIMFSQIDNQEDVDFLRKQLYRRGYGLNTLRGWKRSAFVKGLI